MTPQPRNASSRRSSTHAVLCPRRSPSAKKPAAGRAANLAAAYRADPRCFPTAWRRVGGEAAQLRAIGDFIAGMTDRFAIARHEQLIGPVSLPAGRF